MEVSSDVFDDAEEMCVNVAARDVIPGPSDSVCDSVCVNCSGCVVSAIDETSDPVNVDKKILLDAVDETSDPLDVDKPSDAVNETTDSGIVDENILSDAVELISADADTHMFGETADAVDDHVMSECCADVPDVPKPTYKRCLACGEECAVKIKRCEVYRGGRYCSSACRSAHSEDHASICRHITKLEKMEEEKRVLQTCSVREVNQVKMSLRNRLMKLVGEKPLLHCSIGCEVCDALWDTGAMVSYHLSIGSASRASIQLTYEQFKMDFLFFSFIIRP